MDHSATSRGIASYPQPGAVVQLLKPVTWFPPMWAFACGAVSSGQPLSASWLLVAARLFVIRWKFMTS